MVCNYTDRPHGYGRLIRIDNSFIVDAQFKDGDYHGYVRYIS